MLATRRPRHGRLSAVVLLALALGVGATLALPHAASVAARADDPSVAAPRGDDAERQRLALELAQARADALERQIDTLNQQLRETREELTFFRQAHDAKR